MNVIEHWTVTLTGRRRFSGGVGVSEGVGERGRGKGEGREGREGEEVEERGNDVLQSPFWSI